MTLLLVCLCGCTNTIYEPVETVRTQYEEVAKWRTDTVVDRDTVSLVQRGDTVFSQTVKWRWRVKESHDTVFAERIDSVSVPYPVERRLSRWERTKQDWGGVAMLIVVAGIGAVVAWLATKFRK